MSRKNHSTRYLFFFSSLNVAFSVTIIDPMNTREQGQQIKMARIKAGYTQDAVAALFLRCSKQTVSKWESGIVFPDRKKWPTLEQALNLPPGWFLSLQSDEYKHRAKVRQAVHLLFDGPNESAADTADAAAARNTVPVSRYEELPAQIGLPTNDNKLVLLVTVPILGTIPAGIPEDLPGTMAEYAEDYISVSGVPAGSLGLRVGGDSMSRPDGSGIHRGDIVVFMTSKQPEHRDVVVVNTDCGESVLRRYIVEAGRVFLDADNPQYERITPNGGYRVMGVVIQVQRIVPLS